MVSVPPPIGPLTLPQIDEQRDVLRFRPQPSAPVQLRLAPLIDAGLRRPGRLWLIMAAVQLPRPISGGAGLRRAQANTLATSRRQRSRQPRTQPNRAVPISAALRQHLDRYTPPASDQVSGGGWFFPRPQGYWWDPDNFSADLRDVNKDAGLRWTCLDYRHTFGSQLAQKGVSLCKIATLMENSPDICERHYAALESDIMVAEVEFTSILRTTATLNEGT